MLHAQYDYMRDNFLEWSEYERWVKQYTYTGV